MTQHAPRPSARPGSLRTLTAALGRTRPRPLPSPRSLAFTARFSLPLPSHVVRWEPPAAPKPPARPTTALHVTCPSSVEREISGFGCGGGVWQGAACHGVQAAAIHGRSMLILTLCVLIPSLIPGPDAVLAVLARANTANTDLSMLGFPVLAVLAEVSNTGANTVTSAPASTRAGAGRPPPCWRQCVHCQAPSQRTQQQPSQGGRREASTATASLVHTATGSEQSRRPRRVHTMGSTIGTWPEVAIHENEIWAEWK